MKILGLTVLRTKAAQALQSVASRASAWYGVIREPFSGAWQRNLELDSRETVIAFSAVFSCITRIANDVAKLPPVLKQQIDGIWTVVGSSPYWAVLAKPNRYQNRIQFYSCWMLSKLVNGNTYVLKQRDGRGIVVAMYILDPMRVKPMVAPDGGIYYALGEDLLQQIDQSVIVPASEIIHDRINTIFHPLIGVSPLFACGCSATQGNRIQTNSAKFFENGSRPSGVLTAPGEIKDETAARMKKDWQERFSGDNSGQVAVLGSGLKYEAMTIPANDSQLIEQLKWTVEDVARAFCVPLYKINAGPVPTSNNVESLNQQYYTDCLQTHIEAIELCLDEGLGLVNIPAQTYGVEFDLDVMMRMDAASMMETLRIGVNGAILSPNDARSKLNLPPVTGGNSPMIQMQNYSLAALAKRDSRDDPFAKGTDASTADSDAPDEPATVKPAVDEASDQAAKAVLALIERFNAEATLIQKEAEALHA